MVVPGLELVVEVLVRFTVVVLVATAITFDITGSIHEPTERVADVDATEVATDGHELFERRARQRVQVRAVLVAVAQPDVVALLVGEKYTCVRIDPSLEIVFRLEVEPDELVGGVVRTAAKRSRYRRAIVHRVGVGTDVVARSPPIVRVDCTAPYILTVSVVVEP